jgi:hypothetical protein
MTPGAAVGVVGVVGVVGDVGVVGVVGVGVGVVQAAINGKAAITSIREILPTKITNFFPLI